MARARRACPEGVFLAPRFDAYRDASTEIMRILRSYTPLVEPISLDEAFLDVEGTRRIHGPGPEIAVAVRAQILAETGLTASVGVATTKLVAKLASDLSKPDGLLVVPPGTELEFLHPLGVRRLWGVGPATERKLTALGVRTVGELAKLPESTLVHALGNASGRHLHALAWNRDDRAVQPAQEAKSIGHEETFPTDVTDRAVLEHELVRLADAVASRLRGAQVAARTVQLKLRYGDFRTITRSRTLPEATDLAADIGRVTRELLRAVDLGAGVRLLGISGQQLVRSVADPTAEDQGQLFDEGQRFDEGGAGATPGIATRQPATPETATPKAAAIERSLDAIRAKFGPGAVGPGGANSLQREGPGPPAR